MFLAAEIVAAFAPENEKRRVCVRAMKVSF